MSTSKNFAPMLVLAMLFLPQAKRPDFSGPWEFDPEATEKIATTERIGTNIFGAAFVAHQDAKLLTLDITVAPGQPIVQASYALDGTETKIISPPQTIGATPIVVTAVARWIGHKLIIESRSQQPGGRRGAPTVVDVISTRTIWLDEAGRIVIDRDGTPKPVVPSTRSVYRHPKK